MPLTKFRCEDEKYNDDVSFDFCIEQCAVHRDQKRTCDLTPPILRPIKHNSTRRQGLEISITGILGCHRQTVLEKLNDYSHHPTKMWPALRGVSIHDVIERGQDLENKSIIVERRFSRQIEVDGELVTISGSPDELNIGKSVCIDYKTSKGRIPQAKPDHRMQLQLYRWLVNDGIDQETGEPIHYKIKRLGLVYLGPNDIQKFKVRPKPLDEIEDFVIKRVTDMHRAFNGGEIPAVPKGYDPLDEYHPFCQPDGWCPVSTLCREALEDGKS